MQHNAHAIYPPTVKEVLSSAHHTVHRVGSPIPLDLIDRGSLLIDRTIVAHELSAGTRVAEDPIPLSAMIMKRGLSGYLGGHRHTIPSKAFDALTQPYVAEPKQWSFTRDDLTRIYLTKAEPFSVRWKRAGEAASSDMWFPRLRDALQFLRDEGILDSLAGNLASISLGSQPLFSSVFVGADHDGVAPAAEQVIEPFFKTIVAFEKGLEIEAPALPRIAREIPRIRF